MKNLVRKYLKGRVSGRNIDVCQNDTFLVSYPKSGNTWLRFLVGNVIFEDFNFGNMEELIPDIYVNKNRKLKKIRGKRILKSHEYFDPRYSKVIYIVRDPRSVFISYFEFFKKMNKIETNNPSNEFMEQFLYGGLDTYGTWDENVNSWLGTRHGSDNFLLIRYEDLKKETENTFRNILNFINIECSDTKLRHAITKSSFESMKLNEIENKYKTKALKNSNLELPFLRKGEINEWRNKLSLGEIDKIENKFRTNLIFLGYV